MFSIVHSKNDYFNLRRMDDQLAAKRYNKYLTNAVDVEYPLQIGFDPTDLKDVAEFNASVGSCQDVSNRGSYSFGFADLTVNPHLFILFVTTTMKSLVIDYQIFQTRLE